MVSQTLWASLPTALRRGSLLLGTVLGFAASAALIVSVLPPNPKSPEPRGIRNYFATPRVRADCWR